MPKWTIEQERAIFEKGNLLVSAAAGAGKTAVMTERIARLIAEGTPVNELLVVTFTNPAAAEMKQRIEKRLTELAEQQADGAVRLKLTDAAADVDHANISTIHSFCGNVLRRHYHVAGLDPAFRTADEAEAALLRAEALDEVLEDAYLRAEKHSQANGRSGTTGFALADAVGKDEFLAKLIVDVCNFIIARPNPLEWLKEAIGAYGESVDDFAEMASRLLVISAKRVLKSLYEEGNRLIDEISSLNDDKKYRSCLFADVEKLFALSKQSEYGVFHSVLSTFSLETLPRASKGQKVPDGLKEYRERVKKQIEKLKALFMLPLSEEKKVMQSLQPHMNELFELVRSFMETYSRKKVESSLIDFNDMEQLTLRMLENEEIAEEYRESFRYIFIDEYQDTNLVQEAIISTVSRGNNLFMVGDVKQSIYRFRQAEPENFLGKYRSYDGNLGTRIDLNANFRSTSSILNATNALFSKIMLGSVGEIDYSDNAALRAGGEAEIGFVELDLVDLSAEQRNSDDEDSSDAVEEYARAEAEAVIAGRRIRELLGSCEVYDKNLDRMRPLCYSDCAILMRKTREHALSWVNTLSAMGIPCAAELGDGYFEAIEVQVFINLLRIIDNRRQDIPLVSVLHSPIGGFTNEELVEVKSSYDGTDFVDRLLSMSIDASCQYPLLRDKVNAFLKRLFDWHRQSLLTGIEEFIGQLIDETFYRDYVGTLPGGNVRQANIDMLLTKAHAFESSGRRGLHAFISFMDGMRDNVPIGAASAAAFDAVRVMSIHKSKGLEFPVVFISGISGSFNKRNHSDPAVLDGDLGIGFRAKNLTSEQKSPILRRAIIAKSDEKLVAEEMRILYVAMTRARERLYLIGADKRMQKLISDCASQLSEHKIAESNCYLHWILGAFFPLGLNLDSAEKGLSVSIGGDDLTVNYYHAGKFGLSSTDKTAMSSEKYRAWTAKAKLLPYDEVKHALNFVYPYEKETLLPGKRSVTELLDRPFEYIPAVPTFMKGSHKLTGAEIGTAAHRILMLLPTCEHTPESVRNHILKFEQTGVLSHEEATAVNLNILLKYLNSDLYKRLLLSSKIERELEFTLADENFSLIQGIIDCCFLEGDEWVIIDYKTTHVGSKSPEEVASAYSVQIETYKNALEKLTGKRVKEKWIYLLGTGNAVLI